jgi:hypothetical protein
VRFFSRVIFGLIKKGNSQQNQDYDKNYTKHLTVKLTLFATAENLFEPLKNQIQTEFELA